jgi:hypothetical protein
MSRQGEDKTTTRGIEASGKEILAGPNRDYLFSMLSRLNVTENYLERTVARKLDDVYPEGVERAHKNPIVGAVLFHSFPGIEDYLSHELEPTSQTFEELETRLLSEEEKDGGYIISQAEDGRLQVSVDKDSVSITRKPLVEAHNAKVPPDKRVKSFNELLPQYLPPDFLTIDANAEIPEKSRYNIGTRTQAALAAALTGGQKSYIMKQTVIDGAGVGKVAMFDQTGLRAEFFLYRGTVEELESRYGSIAQEDYINPEQRVVGILRTYGEDKSTEARKEYLITPADLGLSRDIITKYTASSKATDVLAEEPSHIRLRRDLEAAVNVAR